MFNSKKYFLLILLFFFPGTIHGKMQSPLETVKVSNESILALYSSSSDTDEHVLHEIFSIMDGVTDFNVMANRAVQNVCPNTNEDLCKTIRQEFIEVLKLAAMTKLGRYRADRFEYISEKTADQQSVVKTVAHFKDDSVQLDYILEKRGGSWSIVNYLIDEVDTIQNYQRQFKRIVDKEKLSGLLKRLRNKNKQYKKDR